MSNKTPDGTAEDWKNKPDQYWKEKLNKEQYKVTRKKGTERAFTGPNWDNKQPGTYSCICCEQELYDASTKYDSGTGWPSFWHAKDKSISLQEDRGLFSARTEVVCSRCNAHLGHVFDDGPKPTGKRYCMNGVAMSFESDKES